MKDRQTDRQRHETDRKREIGTQEQRERKINEENLCSRDWNQEDLRATIFLEVTGLLLAEQQIPKQQMALTLGMLEDK